MMRMEEEYPAGSGLSARLGAIRGKYFDTEEQLMAALRSEIPKGEEFQVVVARCEIYPYGVGRGPKEIKYRMQSALDVVKDDREKH